MRIEQDYPALARELGLTRGQREHIAASGLVKTTARPGSRTRISDEDAELLRRASALAIAAGIAVIIALRVLTAGGST